MLDSFEIHSALELSSTALLGCRLAASRLCEVVGNEYCKCFPNVRNFQQQFFHYYTHPESIIFHSLRSIIAACSIRKPFFGSSLLLFRFMIYAKCHVFEFKEILIGFQGWPIKSHLVMKGMQKVDKPLEGLNMFTHPQKIQSL